MKLKIFLLSFLPFYAFADIETNYVKCDFLKYNGTWVNIGTSASIDPFILRLGQKKEIDKRTALRHGSWKKDYGICSFLKGISTPDSFEVSVRDYTASRITGFKDNVLCGFRASNLKLVNERVAVVERGNFVYQDSNWGEVGEVITQLRTAFYHPRLNEVRLNPRKAELICDKIAANFFNGVTSEGPITTSFPFEGSFPFERFKLEGIFQL